MALIDVLDGPELAIVPDRQHTVVHGPGVARAHAAETAERPARAW